MPLGIIMFVECKRPDGEVTPAQEQEISKIHSRHHWVMVVDSRLAVDKLLEQYKMKLAYQKKFMQDLIGQENIKEVKDDSTV